MSDFPLPPLPPLPGQTGFPPRYPVQISPAQKFGRDLYAATPRVWVTYVLLAANVAVFLWMVAHGVGFWNPDPDKMIHWGAGFGPLTTHGQQWRLFTEIFLHFGILHITFNMIVLWQIGPLVERLFGNFCFLVIYLLAGLCGSLLSELTHPMSVAGGASGAIFGLFGALFGFLIVQRGAIPRPILKSLVSSTMIFVAYNIAAGLSQKGIDMAAHGGGLVGGMIFGALLTRSLSPRKPAIGRVLIVTILGFTSVAWAAARLPVVDDLQAELQKLDDISGPITDEYDKSVDLWNNKQITDAEFARRLQTDILPPFQKEHARLAGLTGLDADERADWQKTLIYVTARQQQWETLLQFLQTGDSSLLEKSNQLATQADKLSKDLSENN
jgi:membrane associated rhomboid family serine protease